MCEVGRRLWERGLVGATEGNISARLDSERILCTPTGLSKGHMSPGELLVIDNDGKPIGPGQPSSEIKLHVRILARRADCMAVVHAHPPIATAFSVAGEPIPDDLLPEAIYVLGPVVTVPFCMPGTDEVPEGLEPYLADHKTFLLSHHGAATMGRDLWDACNRMETLERIARVVLMARLLGRTTPLPNAALEQMRVALMGEL
jgi:L-fuculose-phosphate aldolase